MKTGKNSILISSRNIVIIIKFFIFFYLFKLVINVYIILFLKDIIFWLFFHSQLELVEA